MTGIIFMGENHMARDKLRVSWYNRYVTVCPDEGAPVDIASEKLDDLLAALPGSFLVIVGRERGNGGVLAAYSDSVPALHGMSDAEFARYRGKDILELLTPQERGRGRHALAEGFSLGRSNDSAYLTVHKAQGGIWLRLQSNYHLSIDGKPACLVAADPLFNNKENQGNPQEMLESSLTSRLANQEKVEEELRQKSTQLVRALDAAERANHAKSDFLSSVSHDIRTPLNAIVNLTALLHDELDDPEKLEEDLQKMEVASEFLLQLINDVLDISAIESGKLTLKPRVYTYSTFLNYIKGIVVPLCENKDINFVLDEGPTALDIYMDRVRFHQVFFNILSNAVKYTPPGGTVMFKTTNNVVHNGILTCDFIVSDTGCGMSPEFLSRVFEPFVREDRSSAYVGTGLGLSICKRLVDLMGGTVAIESELGKGTTVTVHMDLLLATEEQKAESQAELDTSYRRHAVLANGQKPRVLLVEDSLVNQEVLTRLMEKKDYEVERAGNGREAVEAIEAHDGGYYQVVLMDIRMPVMDGLTATALIRQNEDEQKSHVPIIAITADAFEGDMQQCLDAGMNAGLSKPISPNTLYNMLANYIQTEE